MNSTLIGKPFNSSLEDRDNENKIILHCSNMKHEDNNMHEADITNASVDELSAMIVSHMMASVKEDLNQK